LGKIFGLANFIKVFPLSIIVSASLLTSTYFLYKGNGDGTAQIISLVAVLVSAIIFMVTYALHNKVIASEIVAHVQGEEAPSIQEVFSEFKSYGLTTIGLVISFAILYVFILPTIGSMAGGIFQMSVSGFEFNLLTLFMNLCFIVWLMFGSAEANTVEATYLETFKYTIGFVFNNFAKVVAFVVAFVIALFILQFTVVSTAGGDQLVLMPIKALIFAYVIGFVNTLATSIFVNNIKASDFAEDDDDDE